MLQPEGGWCAESAHNAQRSCVLSLLFGDMQSPGPTLTALQPASTLQRVRLW